VLQVQQDQLDYPVQQVPLALLEQQDRRVHLDKLVLQVQQDRLDCPVQQAEMDQQVLQVHRVHRAL
jgi:hypothetical protein